jgi:nucleotide-binding universal stress UspA family protein
METRSGRAASRGLQRREVWVHEKGLPHICRQPLVDHLGQRMLVATDLSDDSSDVDARAIELAEMAGARLLVLAIVAPQAITDDSHQKRLDALLGRARRRGIEAEGRIVMGDPADAILRAAIASRAYAIVIGDAQWRGWKNAGCVCGHVILHAPCRVLITHGRTAA